MAAFAGMLVAALFLSRSYNPVLFLLVGLSLALYKVVGQSGYSVALPSFLPVSAGGSSPWNSAVLL